MNYLAHTIYESTLDINSTVTIFCGMIINRQLAGLFSDQVPEYHLRAFVLEKLI
jgi:hypothetical protein